MYYLVETSFRKQRLKTLILLGFIPIILLSIPFHSKFEEAGTNIYTTIFGILVLIWLLANVYSNFAIPPYEKIGKVYFRNDSIKILRDELPLEEIEEIKVVYNEIYGESNPPGSLAITFGDRNRLVIKTKDGRIYNHKILFEKRSQVLHIQRVLKYYYDLGINVVFYRHNKLIFPKRRDREY